MPVCRLRRVGAPISLALASSLRQGGGKASSHKQSRTLKHPRVSDGVLLRADSLRITLRPASVASPWTSREPSTGPGDPQGEITDAAPPDATSPPQSPTAADTSGEDPTSLAEGDSNGGQPAQPTGGPLTAGIACGAGLMPALGCGLLMCVCRSFTRTRSGRARNSASRR